MLTVHNHSQLIYETLEGHITTEVSNKNTTLANNVCNINENTWKELLVTLFYKAYNLFFS